MNIDYSKFADGLVPAIVQDYKTKKVLMLGFMNEAAVAKTQELQKVTFIAGPSKGYGPKGSRVKLSVAKGNIH